MWPVDDGRVRYSLFVAGGEGSATGREAAATGDITAGLDAAGWHLAGLHIDRACLSSALVRDCGPDLAIFCKAWRVRNAYSVRNCRR